MTAIRAVQTIWLCMLVFVSAWILSRNVNIPTLAIAGMTLIYAFSTVGIFKDRKWAWKVSLIPPVVFFILTGPTTIINVAMFLAGSELYLDSPGTIIVVAINAVFTAIPATVLLLLYWRNRKDIFAD